MACPWVVDASGDMARMVASVVRGICCRLAGRRRVFEGLREQHAELPGQNLG